MTTRRKPARKPAVPPQPLKFWQRPAFLHIQNKLRALGWAILAGGILCTLWNATLHYLSIPNLDFHLFETTILWMCVTYDDQ